MTGPDGFNSGIGVRQGQGNPLLFFGSKFETVPIVSEGVHRDERT